MQSNSLSNRLYNSLKNKTVLYLYIPLAVYWLALFIGTTLPTDEIPNMFKAQDKIEHLLAYFGLAVMVYMWLHFQKKNISLKQNALMFSIVIVLFYGAFDELHQMLVPRRVADITDWTADAIGGIFGVAMVYLFINSNKSQTE
jgi:VanZ family protein